VSATVLSEGEGSAVTVSGASERASEHLVAIARDSRATRWRTEVVRVGGHPHPFYRLTPDGLLGRVRRGGCRICAAKGYHLTSPALSPSRRHTPTCPPAPWTASQPWWAHPMRMPHGGVQTSLPYRPPSARSLPMRSPTLHGTLAPLAIASSDSLPTRSIIQATALGADGRPSFADLRASAGYALGVPHTPALAASSSGVASVCLSPNVSHSPSLPLRTLSG